MAEIIYVAWSISLHGWVEESLFNLESLKINIDFELREYNFIINIHVVYILVAFSVISMVVEFPWSV